MLSTDEQIGVTFNGAIYNFRQLRRDLESSGHVFLSQTDTEVLIHGYVNWGIEQLVARCRGMFAFAIWDNRTQKGYLVRDRLGVKPLFYAVRGGCLAFASTPRALKAGDLVGDIDPVGVAEFLDFGYVTDGRSIYAGVRKLAAATILEWSDGHCREWEYWTLPEPSNDSLPFEDAVVETERLFVDAVRMRLDADVPVGTLLSGGVDSSLVCWAVGQLGAKITAFTVGTGGDPSDEAPDAAKTAAKLGIDHAVVDVNDSEEPDVHELLSAYAEPFSSASALGMLRVSKAVKPYATVLLTGDGGDDIFLGYPQHTRLWFAERIAAYVPTIAAHGWYRVRTHVPRAGSFLRRASHLLDYATAGVAASAIAHDGLPAYDVRGVLGPRLKGRIVPNREMVWSPAAGERVLRDYIHYHRSNRFTGEYMTKVDGATMHYGLEARGPFLDHLLWEFAARLPISVRLLNGQLKAVLREIARRRIGEHVATGRKRGFTIPAQQWMTGRWRSIVDDTFHRSLLASEGWVNEKPLLKWWHSVRTLNRAPVQLWHLFVLENWFRYAHHTDSTVARSSPGVFNDLRHSRELNAY